MPYYVVRRDFTDLNRIYGHDILSKYLEQGMYMIQRTSPVPLVQYIPYILKKYHSIRPASFKS